MPGIPKEAIAITHGYEGLGGGISCKTGTSYFPYQGKAGAVVSAATRYLYPGSAVAAIAEVKV